jgi:hypothetical protein
VTGIILALLGGFLLFRGLPGVVELLMARAWRRVGIGLGAIASAQAARYGPGEEVDVWVDPTEPSKAVLRRSATSSLLIAAVGVAVGIAGVLSFAG